MANESTTARGPALDDLMEQKVQRLQRLLSLTQESLLLVELDDLDRILERKETVLEEIQRLDEQLAELAEEGPAGDPAPRESEIGPIVEAVLANERALEERIQNEQTRVRIELRNLERETRVKRYLESTKPERRKVDLTR